MFNKLIKKAAMFGLDARITLVIFMAIGTISFISYNNKITKSNATQYVTDMNSIKDAYKAFLSDTGYKLTSYSNPYYYNVSELVTLAVDNNKPYTKKYNGPYLEYNLTGSNNLIQHPILKNNIAFVSRSFKDDWATQAHPGTTQCSSADCLIWLVFFNVKPEMAIGIDKIVDSADGADSGKIRLIANGSNYDVFMPVISE